MRYFDTAYRDDNNNKDTVDSMHFNGYNKNDNDGEKDSSNSKAMGFYQDMFW